MVLVSLRCFNRISGCNAHVTYSNTGSSWRTFLYFNIHDLATRRLPISRFSIRETQLCPFLHPHLIEYTPNLTHPHPHPHTPLHQGPFTRGQHATHDGVVSSTANNITGACIVDGASLHHAAQSSYFMYFCPFEPGRKQSWILIRLAWVPSQPGGAFWSPPVVFHRHCWGVSAVVWAGPPLRESRGMLRPKGVRRRRTDRMESFFMMEWK